MADEPRAARPLLWKPSVIGTRRLPAQSGRDSQDSSRDAAAAPGGPEAVYGESLLMPRPVVLSSLPFFFKVKVSEDRDKGKVKPKPSQPRG